MSDFLTQAELDGLDRSYRFQIAARALNLSELERLIINAFLIDDRPWPVQKLEHYTGYTRAAIRRHLRDLLVMKLAEDIPRQGWVLTPLGRSVMVLVFRELLSIAAGHTRRFSTGLIELLADINTEAADRPFKLPSGNVV